VNYKDLIEFDDDAEMIDLGVASLETEGVGTGYTEGVSPDTSDTSMP
jgi:hypothetical protein